MNNHIECGANSSIECPCFGTCECGCNDITKLIEVYGCEDPSPNSYGDDLFSNFSLSDIPVVPSLDMTSTIGPVTGYVPHKIHYDSNS
jgi:hypothetical protein